MTARDAFLNREVTFNKLVRDADNLRTYARFVILLKEGSQIEVIDNGNRRTQGLPYAKIIAVLGPVQHEGQALEESVLLEIGYSRTRPYAQLEVHLKNEDGQCSGQRWFLKPRSRVQDLSDEELVRVYPHIVQCVTAVVLEQRDTWLKKGTWWVSRCGEVERGIYFTVSQSDELLHRKFALEDVRYRKNRYIRRHAGWIRWLLGRYKYSSYTPIQIRAFTKARCIADMLKQDHYTPFYRNVLCRCLAKGSHSRKLLDLVIETFGINVSLTEQEARMFEPTAVSLPWLVNLQCYRPPEQPTVHACGSTVFELSLERRYREQNEVPF